MQVPQDRPTSSCTSHNILPWPQNNGIVLKPTWKTGFSAEATATNPARTTAPPARAAAVAVLEGVDRVILGSLLVSLSCVFLVGPDFER